MKEIEIVGVKYYMFRKVFDETIEDATAKDLHLLFNMWCKHSELSNRVLVNFRKDEDSSEEMIGVDILAKNSDDLCHAAYAIGMLIGSAVVVDLLDDEESFEFDEDDV